MAQAVTLGVRVEEALGQALGEKEGVGVADCEAEPQAVALGQGERVGEVVGEREALRDWVTLRLRLGDMDCVGEPVLEAVAEGQRLPLLLPLRVSMAEALLELLAPPVCVRAGEGLRVREGERVSVPLAVLQALGVADTLRERVPEGVREGVVHAVEEREGLRLPLEHREALGVGVGVETREAVAWEEPVRDGLGLALAEALALQEGGVMTPAGQ